MSTENRTATPSENDRIMAALAHVTVVLPLMGVIAPIIIWATQKDKSEYVAFQALQAVVYQLVMILAWFAGMVLYMGSFFGMFLTIPLSGPSRSAPFFVFVPFGIMGLMMLGSLVFIIYGLVAAALVLQGKDFRYLIIGNWLRKFLHWDGTQ